MLLQEVKGARLEALEDFSIGSLDLSITLWMSNGCIADFDAKILTVSMDALLVNWDPLSVMILFGTPTLQTMDSMNLTMDCLLILTKGVASDHLVNLSMVTYIYQNPPMALGNVPSMSIPHTTNDREGRIICSVYASVWIFLAWNWHTSCLFSSSMESWRAVGQ
jgi:hypothetical protein